MKRVFVAGATGYTGRSVVRECTARGIATVAHVRPDSASRDRWTETFEGLGAVVDSTTWEPERIRDALTAYRPDTVFALLGTTAKRGRLDGSTYETVDFGLTVMLLHAAATLEPTPRFVYLSSSGAGGSGWGAYLNARVKSESEIVASGVPHLIARPAIITGPDRDENRPLERTASTLLDGLLAGLGALGLKGPQRRWGSLTGPELGRALVTLAAEGRQGVVEAGDLRAAVGSPG